MTRRLKILHLTASLSVGGGERMILELAKHTNKTQFETYVCAVGQFHDQTLITEFQELGSIFHIIPNRDFYNLARLQAIAAYIREKEIDLIQTHLIDADIMGAIIGKWLRIPVITTLQNDHQNYQRQRRDRHILARIMGRYAATHLVAVSEQIRRSFIKEWRIPADRISTIHNSIHLNRFLPIAPGTPVGTPLTITNIASLSPQKAQDLLLEAAKIVLTEMPDVSFMIVGRGRLEQILKEKAHALGIADHIQFTGLRHDIPDILARSDIFVLSSLWEGLPVSGVEAMAAARAVVLTDVGGNRELIPTEQHGRIVPPNDVPALAHALLQLLRDEPTRIAMGQVARAHVEQTFSIKTCIEQYETLYLTIWQQYYGHILPAIASGEAT